MNTEQTQALRHCRNGAMCSATDTGAAIAARASAMYSTTSTALRTQQELGTTSSRVPGPTVDRRVSVNSGAERMGATTMCLDMCVMTENRRNDVS